MTNRSATSTVTYEDPSRYLSSSISSLSSARAQSSWIAKSYRHAAQLYLTRRLSEALEAIEPVITPEEQDHRQTNGHADEDTPQPAPVAAASRGTRVKVWSFYLTLLNAIIEVGPEEGKLSFGSTKWKVIAAKARDGTVWDEVVRYGYGGSDGEVDGEVVINLATLLLTHMPSQKLNQQRLETYLSASATPSFDVTAHMAASRDGSRSHSRSNTNGTSTPRDLNTRLKLLELYTLHVLPRNDEWEYSREFINISEVLDDERREAFQAALVSLQEEKDHDAMREAELRKRQEEEMEKRRQDEERQSREAAQAEQERQRQQSDIRPSSAGSSRGKPSSVLGAKSPHVNGQPPAASSRQPKPQKKNLTPPPGLYKRATLLMSSLQSSLLHARHSLAQNPMAMLRFVLFLFAFAMAFARRDVRERLKRTFQDVWNRVRRTIGMGVKVSYI